LALQSLYAVVFGKHYFKIFGFARFSLQLTALQTGDEGLLTAKLADSLYRQHRLSAYRLYQYRKVISKLRRRLWRLDLPLIARLSGFAVMPQLHLHLGGHFGLFFLATLISYSWVILPG